ncbi:MAG TPA: ATP-binding cassette domain-containing protein [Ktedonobacteraceae bacterium]|jgi:ABC-2 type transport system ATP-binding protein|nr:ATP-binding cassette domain-containing protein [Ktedonobacteraceae bacterium]
MTENVIEVEKLVKRFGNYTAVDQVSFAVPQGEVFALLGPNGAGKSTMIKMLTTLLPPTSGKAYVVGADVTTSPMQARKRIGYVPQALSADGSLSGYENLMVFASLYDIPRPLRAEKARNALDFMGLHDSADKLVRTYSGGMIRRLEVAQAMLHQPEVLFLDEPTVGLDPVARKAVWDHLSDLRSETGMTIFLTTHYMEEADNLCDRIAIMHFGKVVALGSPAELKTAIGNPEASLDEVFAQFTGNTLESGGSFRDTARTRRTAQRLG